VLEKVDHWQESCCLSGCFGLISKSLKKISGPDHRRYCNVTAWMRAVPVPFLQLRHERVCLAVAAVGPRFRNTLPRKTRFFLSPVIEPNLVSPRPPLPTHALMSHTGLNTAGYNITGLFMTSTSDRPLSRSVDRAGKVSIAIPQQTRGARHFRLCTKDIVGGSGG